MMLCRCSSNPQSEIHSSDQLLALLRITSPTMRGVDGRRCGWQEVILAGLKRSDHAGIHLVVVFLESSKAKRVPNALGWRLVSCLIFKYAPADELTIECVMSKWKCYLRLFFTLIIIRSISGSVIEGIWSGEGIFGLLSFTNQRIKILVLLPALR